MFHLHRGRATNLFERWHLKTGLVPLRFGVGGVGTYEVGGARSELGGDSGAGSFQALPGGYVVKLADNPLLSSDTVTVVAGSAEQPPVVSVRLKPDAVGAVDQQVRAVINACAEIPENRPQNCSPSVARSRTPRTSCRRPTSTSCSRAAAEPFRVRPAGRPVADWGTMPTTIIESDALGPGAS